MGIDVKIVKAKDDTDILEINSHGKLFRMNSTYKPREEASRYATQFETYSDNNILFIFGFGNGIIPEAIRQNFKGTIVFYEPSKEVVDVLTGYNYSKICNGEDTILVMPEGCELSAPISNKFELPLLLESLITYSNYDNVVYGVLPKYKELFYDEYCYFSETIESHINKLKGNIETAKLMGKEAVENNILNMKYISGSFCADDFVDVFPKEMPAIIVSAGPSLVKNIHMVKCAKGKALIICVDTALKYMLDSGELPDCIISVDPKIMLSVFDDERLAGIPILASFETNNKILEKFFNSPIVFVSTENTYIQHIYKKIGHKIERIRSGGSVSTMAFSLCVYWGFRNIILIGQDLALTGSYMYADGNKIDLNNSEKTLIEVQDINGSTVYTYGDYYRYLKWFEQEIPLLQDVSVIDATEGGALIRGSLVMTFEEAIKKYCQGEMNYTNIFRMDVAKPIDERASRIVWSIINESKKRLQELDNKINFGMELIGDEKHNEEIEDIFVFYEEMDESYIIQRQIDATMLDEFMGIFEGEISSAEEQKERLYKYFNCLKEALIVIKKIWEQLYD